MRTALTIALKINYRRKIGLVQICGAHEAQPFRKNFFCSLLNLLDSISRFEDTEYFENSFSSRRKTKKRSLSQPVCCHSCIIAGHTVVFLTLSYDHRLLAFKGSLLKRLTIHINPLPSHSGLLDIGLQGRPL